MGDKNRKDQFRHGEGEHYHALGSASSPAGGEGDLGTTLPTEEQVEAAERKKPAKTK